MPDPSNPTGRVIDVLNFLAAHPTESFSLAEIARAVGLSNGSAHRLLTTLAASQFLSRHPKHRTYALGLALVAIGQAAIEKHRGIDIARREIATLAAELGVQCSANTVVDGDILVLAKAGMAQSHLGLTAVGERRPLLPPVGICHIAWSDAATIADYVGQAEPYLSPPMLAHLRAAFPLVRRRGFAAAASSEGAAYNARAITVLPANRLRDAAYWQSVFAMIGQLTAEEIQISDLADLGARGLSYMSAPVFSPAGTVAFQLVISGLPRALSSADAERCAERLCATAARITAETHGRHPAI